MNEQKKIYNNEFKKKIKINALKSASKTKELFNMIFHP